MPRALVAVAVILEAKIKRTLLTLGRGRMYGRFGGLVTDAVIRKIDNKLGHRTSGDRGASGDLTVI